MTLTWETRLKHKVHCQGFNKRRRIVTFYLQQPLYEIIGDRERAVAELHNALGAGFSLEDVKREPELQALRSDQRYQQMLRKQVVHNN